MIIANLYQFQFIIFFKRKKGETFFPQRIKTKHFFTESIKVINAMKVEK